MHILQLLKYVCNRSVILFSSRSGFRNNPNIYKCLNQNNICENKLSKKVFFSRAEIDTLACDSKGSMVNPSFTIHGKNVQKAVLQKGDMIYVAPGWALQVLQNKANKVYIY